MSVPPRATATRPMNDLPNAELQKRPSREDLTGSTVGRFAVRARLGRGGMGEVYQAEDTKLKRTVALKRMAPRLQADEYYRRRFLKEAERASSLTHQHIADIYDVLEEDGEIFVVMEYVEGETLRQRLGKPMPVSEFLPMAVQCGEALAAAHEKGVVHRDIKPENIMLNSSGQVKILDFGVAKRLPRPDDVTVSEAIESTIPGLSGTSGYMAPEVLLERESDERVDIFSLGVVFYEALTGRHPFRAESFLATSNRILREVPTPVSRLNPSLPGELDHIMDRMLAKDPAERYGTARDLVRDLGTLGRGEALPAIQPRRQTLAGMRAWLRRVPALARSRVAAVSLVLVLALGVGAVVLRQPLRNWLGLTPLPEKKNLVVLSFETAGSGGPENRAYTDGLMEALTANLTRLTATHALQLTPASEVRARRMATPDEARKETGANLVLVGTVNREGNAVRVNFALVDANTQRQLRTRTVTGTASNPFAFQERVVAGVLDTLDIGLQREERNPLAGSHNTQPATYDAYLQGRGYLQDFYKLENVERAIQAFQRAVEIDPNYAPAHAGLGEAYWKKHYYHTREARWVEPARQACEQAVKLDEKLAAAHLCLGVVYSGTGAYEKAVEELNRALEVEPTNDKAYRDLGYAQEQLRQMEAAEQTYRRAIKLRPHYWAGYTWLGGFYYKQARYAEAGEQFWQVVSLAPDNYRGYYSLGGIYLAQGRYPEAIAMLERSVALRPSAEASSNLGTAYFSLQRYREASHAYEKAVKLAPANYLMWGNLADAYYWDPPMRDQAADAYRKAVSVAEEGLKVNPRSPHLLGNLAYYHAMVNEREPALRYLRRALQVAPDDPDLRFKAALVHNQLGEPERALKWLVQALTAGLSPAIVRDTPNLKNLLETSRMQELVRKH